MHPGRKMPEIPYDPGCPTWLPTAVPLLGVSCLTLAKRVLSTGWRLGCSPQIHLNLLDKLELVAEETRDYTPEFGVYWQ
jgi:hypothetical protein